jgi:hypothetical protein
VDETMMLVSSDGLVEKKKGVVKDFLPELKRIHPRGRTRRIAPLSDNSEFLFLGLTRLRHPAIPFEDHTFVDDHGRGFYVAEDLSGRMDFDSLACNNIPAYFSADNDMIHINVGFNMSRFPDDEGPFRIDLSFETAVDPDGSCERKFAFELRVAPQKRIDLISFFHWIPPVSARRFNSTKAIFLQEFSLTGT